MIEDIQLVVSLKVFGDKNWSMISTGVPHRTDVKGRERYGNILDPRINHSKWTQEEDKRLLETYEQMPGKWSKIAVNMVSRTDNQGWRRHTVLKGSRRK